MLAVQELGRFSESEVTALLTLPEVSWNQVRLETRALLYQVMRQDEISVETLEIVLERVPALVPLDLPQDAASLVTALVQHFIKPNSFYDQAATQEAKQQAAQETGPVFRTIRSDEVIIREGNVITDLEIEMLVQLGLTAQQRDWQNFVSIALFSGGATVLLGVYLLRVQPRSAGRTTGDPCAFAVGRIYFSGLVTDPLRATPGLFFPQRCTG